MRLSVQEVQHEDKAREPAGSKISLSPVWASSKDQQCTTHHRAEVASSTIVKLSKKVTFVPHLDDTIRNQVHRFGLVTPPRRGLFRQYLPTIPFLHVVIQY